jgi:hypothetical protein
MERWVERVSEGVGVESKITLRGGKGAVVDEYDHVNAQSITRCSSSCGPANGPFDKQRRNICVMLRLFGLSLEVFIHTWSWNNRCTSEGPHLGFHTTNIGTVQRDSR